MAGTMFRRRQWSRGKAHGGPEASVWLTPCTKHTGLNKNDCLESAWDCSSMAYHLQVLPQWAQLQVSAFPVGELPFDAWVAMGDQLPLQGEGKGTSSASAANFCW